MVAAEALAELRVLCPAATVKNEAGQVFVDLPDLKIPTGKQIVARDALLTMQPHSGYASRLFLSEPITGRGANWTVHCVLGRTWHTPSWRDVAPGRAIEMLLQHLKVYQ
jgi:hypothetical protein